MWLGLWERMWKGLFNRHAVQSLQPALQTHRDAAANKNRLLTRLDEISASADLDKMTEELAECYEELHLVYSLDRHNRMGVGQDTDTFRQMLQDTAAHLNVDVVAFVRPADEFSGELR